MIEKNNRENDKDHTFKTQEESIWQRFIKVLLS